MPFAKVILEQLSSELKNPQQKLKVPLVLANIKTK